MYLERFNGTVALYDTKYESFSNSIYINDGYNLITNNVNLTFGKDMI